VAVQFEVYQYRYVCIF